jgi:branched-chain amino acid transport system ATP-binding protein
MTEVLRLERVVAGHRGVPAVRDLSMTVAAGEIVALLGPNGAGKTTTLRTISGLLPRIDGTITVLGRSSTERSAHRLARSGVAHVLEERALFNQLTVEENLRLGGRSPDALDRAFHLFPNLETFANRRAGLLSGGEQQMLALARALVGMPRLLMIDEMSLGLAPVIVERLLDVVRRIADDEGCAVLVVEQHVASALQIADRAYVLSHGTLIAEGPASAMTAQADLLTAGYFDR